MEEDYTSQSLTWAKDVNKGFQKLLTHEEACVLIVFVSKLVFTNTFSPSQIIEATEYDVQLIELA